MLSGQLVTTSTVTNFIDQSQFYIEEDESCSSSRLHNDNIQHENNERKLSTIKTSFNNNGMTTINNGNELQITKQHCRTSTSTTKTNNSTKTIPIKSNTNKLMNKNYDIGYNIPPSFPIFQSTGIDTTVIVPAISTGCYTIDSSSATTTNEILECNNSSATTTPLPIVTNNNNNNNNCNYINNIVHNNINSNTNNDATGRSAALERAYVHDVYANCEEPTGPIRPRVAQFLAGLEPGSIVCDVGCGNGRYLTACNPFICTIGVDRCYRLTKVAKEKGGEVALCDNLDLPFRDESFDAVLSLAVVHHFATTERRVGAIRELARILRIGGRVIISVWALEQRHRRFESQDVLIPWQPPKNRTVNYSDEEDEDDYLPPYHAYTEDSTNSSRSAGDGDSSSLSSSSPGESCYSFVRRAIQKLAGGRKHPWFLESWNSKDTKNDSSLDYEDAKDLPIELRRLEDFEDFPDPPLSAGLKSRSLGSILNPPPRQIVRSRSSVPSLGSCIVGNQQQIFFPEFKSQFMPIQQQQQSGQNTNSLASSQSHLQGLLTSNNSIQHTQSSVQIDVTGTTNSINISPTKCVSGGGTNGNCGTGSVIGTPTAGRRPKLIKQKQSLCDEEYQLPDNNTFHSSNLISKSNSISSGTSTHNSTHNLSSNIQSVKIFQKQYSDSRLLLRKQSSLNEELMAENRLREKERVRKRIQKQMSLNEAFLCRSVFTKRLQIIREGFTTKLKTSTGSLERVTKNSLVKIMKNFQTNSNTNGGTSTQQSANASCNNNGTTIGHNTTTDSHKLNEHSNHKTNNNINTNLGKCSISRKNSCNSSNSNDDPQKPRRHSRESGSDSSKDSSLQSDTSIESEDSFASVIFIPKTEQSQQQSCNHQQQQQQIYQQQHKYSSSTNSSGSNNGTSSNPCNNCLQYPNGLCTTNHQNCKSNCNHVLPSLPTSPLIMPCPPTPAHSPAAQTSGSSSVISPPLQIVSGMLLSPPNLNITTNNTNLSNLVKIQTADIPAQLNDTNNGGDNDDIINKIQGKKTSNNNINNNNRFTFDDADIKQQQKQEESICSTPLTNQQTKITNSNEKLGIDDIERMDIKFKKFSSKITRQSIKDLPPIPKFRKQQSLQLISKTNFPMVRRSSATPNITKLMSLELFNPETDDLDSDSSEASSPDSIDSVINAKSVNNSTGNDDQPEITTIPTSDMPNLSKLIINNNNKKQLDMTNNELNFHNDQEILMKMSSNNKDNLIISTNNHPITNNDDQDNDKKMEKVLKNSSDTVSRQEFVDFAEQLSAQLLKRIDEKNRKYDKFYDRDDDSDGENKIDGNNCETNECLDQFTDHPYTKTRNNDGARDLTEWREELRERRLNLANLSTQPSLQQSPISSSTSSLSSQTRSYTIHEEDEDCEEGSSAIDGNCLAGGGTNNSYGLQANYYDGRYKNLKSKHRGNFPTLDYRHYSINPETAYLIQDMDGDSLSRDDDDDDIEHHNVIIEEDEEEEYENHQNNNNDKNDDDDDDDCNDEADDDDDDEIGDNGYSKRTSRNTIRCQDDSTESPTDDIIGITINDSVNQANVLQEQPTTLQENVISVDSNGAVTNIDIGTGNGNGLETWALTNSSNSLDSPSQSGGSTTHHRYYHVFREGELDALINHHVTSLHIVSSYYERASWCVVAEKVQVWTI